MPGTAKNSLGQGVQRDRASKHDTNQRVGERVSADVPQAVENLHARDTGIIENQRNAQFCKRPDEYDGGACEESRLNERKRDLEESSESNTAEIFCGFFHRWIDVRQSSNGI